MYVISTVVVSPSINTVTTASYYNNKDWNGNGLEMVYIDLKMFSMIFALLLTLITTILYGWI